MKALDNRRLSAPRKWFQGCVCLIEAAVLAYSGELEIKFNKKNLRASKSQIMPGIQICLKIVLKHNSLENPSFHSIFGTKIYY